MPVTDIPLQSEVRPAQPQGVTALAHWGVLRAQGEDAAKFLHSQLTNDFALLGLSEARLAAFCNAKGRMLASFIGFKQQHDDILLLCPRETLPAALKRLSMFVLRAKVRLSDATADFDVQGLAGDAVPSGLSAWQHLCETVAVQGDDDNGATGTAHTVALYPGAGVPRAIRIAPAGAETPQATAMTVAEWDWLEVMSGVGMITPPVAEAFVPQMLNYESVGGVNFKKGCYPGQEVVARSQFRGTLKRRAFLVTAPTTMTVGQAIFHSSDAEQACGTVAAAAPTPGAEVDKHHAIVSMTVAAAQGGSLHLGAVEGPQLQLLPLPYPLLADV